MCWLREAKIHHYDKNSIAGQKKKNHTHKLDNWKTGMRTEEIF